MSSIGYGDHDINYFLSCLFANVFMKTTKTENGEYPKDSQWKILYISSPTLKLCHGDFAVIFMMSKYNKNGVQIFLTSVAYYE